MKTLPALHSHIADAQERANIYGIRMILADIEPGLLYRWFAPYLLIARGSDNGKALDALIAFIRRHTATEIQEETQPNDCVKAGV